MMISTKLKLAAGILLSGIWFMLSAQPSIHQQELAFHRSEATNQQLIGDRSVPPIPLVPKPSKLNSMIFGYLPYWGNSSFLNYDLLTHIAAFSVEVSSQGQITNAHGWPWNNLINTAHSHGVKVILVATLFNGDAVHTLMTTPAYKTNFFNNMKVLVLQGNADGVNVDFESLNRSDRGAVVNNFMADFSAFMHSELPGSEVSFAGPAVNWGGWEFSGLAAACDYIFIMGYSFAGSWSSTSFPMAPLTGGTYNITNTVVSQYASVLNSNPQKLILGCPYYGYHWRTSDGSARSSVVQSVGSVTYSSAYSGAATYGRRWDALSQTPWYRYQNGTEWHQVWYDDAQSLGLKYDLAIATNLGGIGMWALGYDGNLPDLWDLIDLKFGSGQLPPPAKPIALRVDIESSTQLRVQFQAAANATKYFIYLSSDGVVFSDSLSVSTTDIIISGLQSDSLYYLRVRSANSNGMSQPTAVLAGVPSAAGKSILVVNGFDRTSGTNNSFNFIRQHADAIHANGFALSSAENEAISLNLLSLRDFEMVDWILGDESTADDTFNGIEQDSIKSFLRHGGQLFVSGAEIGWDLVERGSIADQNFYRRFLKAEYLEDAPLNQPATWYGAEAVAGGIFDGVAPFSFDDGTHGTFDVDWPDAIAPAEGSQNCLKFQGVTLSDASAGVYYEGFFPGGNVSGRLVHLSVPFETVYPQMIRRQLMQRILDWFGQPLSIIPEKLPEHVESFILYQNYPNPFNPETVIRFELKQPARITLQVFDLLGRKISGFESKRFSAGVHSWRWDGSGPGGERAGSGTYVYRVTAYYANGQKHVMSRKMILMR